MHTTTPINRPWVDILSPAQVDAHFEELSRLDASFAAASAHFYATRSDADLAAIARQAWRCNEGERHQLARSMLSHRADRLADAAAA
ncbi:hypothetical protein [Zavarzinia aquatilis]|uniref:Uncharacterized protein n=1 Tax=Zavarzinia aquatilis TaxID=2211142 RepID=A0A317EFU6_9PROT|nr:hypothetical protein [Zavarzinia aquatilis]PWR24960.1 hypothetical protein DKG74_04110 [Zavarzinia aquatilis]